MTDLSYSHGQLAKDKLRYHGLTATGSARYYTFEVDASHTGWRSSRPMSTSDALAIITVLRRCFPDRSWPDNPAGICPCHDSPQDHESDELAAAAIRAAGFSRNQPEEAWD